MLGSRNIRDLSFRFYTEARWSRRGESVYANEVIISSGPIFAPSPNDSSDRGGKYYHISFLHGSDFLNDIAVQRGDRYRIERDLFYYGGMNRSS